MGGREKEVSKEENKCEEIGKKGSKKSDGIFKNTSTKSKRMKINTSPLAIRAKRL